MRLAQKCRLVKGAKKAAIYDLETGNVYSLNERGRHIVAGRDSDETFWKKLLEMGLAVDTVVDETALAEDIIPEVGLRFMWLELTDACNLRCVHCYTLSGPQVKSQDLEVEVWRRIIREGAALGCKKVQFTGGEAFKYGHVLDLAAFAKGKGYDFIEIFTNATLLTSEKAGRIRELGLHMAVSLYSRDPTIHEQITQTPGSFRTTNQGLQLLKKFGIPTRVAIIVMKQNESTVTQTQHFVQNLEVKYEKIDIVRPMGRGNVSDLLPTNKAIAKWGLVTKPNFRTNRERFALYRYWNSCWAGKIAITSSGNVLPCIFARDHIVGNVLNHGLKEIVFNEGLQKLWKITKDDIDVCRDCEYRYTCRDCRPLAESQTRNLTAKFPRCTYDPYSGIWGNEIQKRR